MTTEEEKIAKKIANRNRIFNAKNKAEKRVAIARDVIAQIKLEHFKAKAGTWLNFNHKTTLHYLDFEKMEKSESVQHILMDDSTYTCNCCALGSLFASCTLFNNGTTAKDFQSSMAGIYEDQGPACNLAHSIKQGVNFSNGLTEIFEKEQLELIEMYFENNTGGFRTDNPEKARRVQEWYCRYYSSTDRMIAIMENIIFNNSVFIPEVVVPCWYSKLIMESIEKK